MNNKYKILGVTKTMYQLRNDGMYKIDIEPGEVRMEINDNHDGSMEPITAIDFDRQVFKRGLNNKPQHFPPKWYMDDDPRWTKMPK